MTDDTNDSDRISIELPTDKHRRGMWSELVDLLGEDAAKDMLAANLEDATNGMVTQLYDNREQIAQQRQQFTANPADEGEDA